MVLSVIASGGVVVVVYLSSCPGDGPCAIVAVVDGGDACCWAG